MNVQRLPDLASQAHLRSRLHHLLAFSSPFIFLAGAAGSGRTLLCEQLVSMFDSPPWRVAFVSCQNGLPLPRLREVLISQLIPAAVFNPEDCCADSLFRLLGAEHRALLLVIDDADQAADGLIAELWELYSINDALPQPHKISVLLCGTAPWCESQARSLKGHAGPALELDVEPLPTDEQMALLEYCLRRADYYALLPNPAALADKLRLCAGNPGQIVALAESIMSKKSPTKRTHLPTHKVVASVAVVAALVLLLSWVIPPLLTGTPTPPASEPLPVVGSAAMTTVIPAEQSVKPVEDKAPLPADAVSQADLDAKLPAEQRRVVIADHVVKQIMSDPRSGKAVSAAQTTASAAVATPVSGAMAPVSGAVTSLQQLSPLAEELKAAPLPAASSSAVSAAASGAVSAAAAAIAPPTHDKAAAKATTNSAAKPVVATDATAGVMGSTSELKQKSLRGYTIQLSAGSEAAALVRYAKQKNLSGRYWIYQTQYNGKPWYVLILGEYGSAKQAKAAINAMPAALRQSQPWPKSFGQVQKEMK